VTNGYLLDTDVISQTAKPKPAERVLAFLADLDELCLSAITVYELDRGIRGLRPGRQRTTCDERYSYNPRIQRSRLHSVGRSAHRFTARSHAHLSPL